MTDDGRLYPDRDPWDAIYAAMDPPVRELVRVLNTLPGVRTLSSCGGHNEPVSLDSLPADQWYVTVVLEPRDADEDVHAPSAQAWLDLELLAYHVNAPPWRGRAVALEAHAKPPHLNFPGRMLAFNLVGWRGEDGVEPDDLAASILHDLDELYTDGS